MNENLLNRINLILVAIVAWVIGMKKLIEPDMWWYIRTGEWITKNEGVPKEDVFSFTFSGVEWINVKWLYELVVYGFAQIGGPEFTSIFQSIIGVTLVLVLYGIYKLISERKNLALWTIISLITLFICSYRMTGRPETISHLFSLLVVFVFLKSKKCNIKAIYFWVPIQLLWVNFHEAYATGIVIMGAFVFGDIVKNKLQQKALFDKQLIIAFASSIAAVVINPRGFSMLLHPFEIFGQLSDNKFTAELFSWNTSFYWDQWEAWAFVMVFGLALISLFLGKIKNPIDNFKQNIYQFEPGYYFVLILFAYLGLTAYRNIPFFVLLASPLLVVGIQKVLTFDKIKGYLALGSILISCFAWWLIVSNTFYQNTGSRNLYGLEVDPTFNPIGMTEELEKLDYGQAHFSDYLSSSYPLWKITDYQSFIDLRDLDVFPKSFFEEVLSATQSFEVFEKMDELNNFQFAYLKRSDFPTLLSGLQQSPNWKMVYADPVAVLFTKTEDITHQDIFEDYKSLDVSAISSGLNIIFNPFYTIKKADVNMDYMAATFYQSTGDNKLVFSRVEKLMNDPEFKYNALCLRAQVYNDMELKSPSDSLILLQWNDLTEAKKLERKNGKAYFQMGLALYQRGRTGEAVSEFKTSLKHNENNADAWSYLADCQNALSQTDPANAAKYTNNWFKYMEKALAFDPNNSLIAYRLGVSYCERNECEKAKPILKKLGPLPYLRDEDNDALMNCKEKCDAL